MHRGLLAGDSPAPENLQSQLTETRSGVSPPAWDRARQFSMGTGAAALGSCHLVGTRRGTLLR